ncbi:MAG TPA: response regulator [Gemmata sp.]|nr:response regulator [Gemmata sp.]
MSTKILHLEDSDLDADLIAQRLARAGFAADVAHARGRAEFLAHLGAPTPFDVVLSDYQLPDIDGPEALRLAREYRPEVPFLIVTGALGEELAVETLKLGATDYVLKHRLEHLAPAIERAVAEARERAERRRAEHAAREAAERLELAQTASRSGVFDWIIPEGRVVWEPELEDLYGIPRGSFEETYDAWVARVVPDDAAAVGAAVRRCLEERTEAVGYEFRVVLPDGTRRWLAGKARFLFAADGTPLRMVGINIDIHDRKLVEEQLRRSEERLRLAHEAGRLGAWELDPATGALDCSAVFKAHLGLPATAPTSYDVLRAAAHPDDRDALSGGIDHALNTRSDYDAQYRVVWPDGSVHWVRARGRVVNGHDSTPRRLVGVSQDVTDEKRDEEAIRRQNERLRLLADAAEGLLAAGAPDQMMRDLFARVSEGLRLSHYFNYELDGDGRHLRLVACAGVPPDELERLRRLDLGQAVCGLVAATRRPVVVGDIQNSDDPRVQLVRGYGVRAYACHPLTAGDAFLGTLSFAASDRDRFSDEDVEVIRTICHYVAMAKERQRLAADARDRAERLREQDRRKDEFLALLAHELRNPLAPLRNGVQILRLANGRSDSAARARDMMERQLAHMVRLIDDLLDISRINQDKLHLRVERVTLDRIVESAAETVRPLIAAAGHSFAVRLPEEPVVVEGDLTRLAQVFSNLLTNSAKYTPPGGRIALDAEVRGDRVAVAVRDNGMGVPAAYLPRIFERFSQAGRLVEQASGGLGIGLALVKAIVEMHGGSVEAHSDGPDRGSTFTVELPLACVPDRAAEPPADGPSGKWAKSRILVVDDNVDAAESLGLMLELLGNEVHLAHDGLAAVEAAERLRPDVIFMDIGMPGIDGLEAVARIRARPWPKPVTIIALTGWGQVTDHERSREAGCDAHLVKPVGLQDLEQVLGRYRPVRPRRD